MDDLVVVDDGSGADAEAVLRILEDDGATVVRSTRNRGIAAALNTGTRLALEMGATHVLHSDQDTVLPPDYVAVALDVFRSAHPVTRVGIVCADSINGGPALPTWTSPEGLGLVPEAIQTGFVIAREVLVVAGLLDERLVIDCVDTEFCLRARDAGFRIAIARGTDIAHSIGRREPVRILGIPVRTRSGTPATYEYHAPYRRYYITRNNVDLILRNVWVRPRWCAAVLKRSVYTNVVSVVSGPRGGAEAAAMLTGFVDGMRRRRGKIPPRLERILRRPPRGAAVA